MPGEDDAPAAAPTGQEPAARPDATVVDDDDGDPGTLGPRIDTAPPAPAEAATTIGPAPPPSSRSKAGLPQVPPRRNSRGEVPAVSAPPAAEVPVGRRSTRGDLPQVARPPGASRSGLPGVKGPPPPQPGAAPARRASVPSMPAARIPEGHRPTRPGAEPAAPAANAEAPTGAHEPLMGTSALSTDVSGRRPGLFSALGSPGNPPPTDPQATDPARQPLAPPMDTDPGPTTNQRSPLPADEAPLGDGPVEASTGGHTPLGAAGTADTTGAQGQLTQPPLQEGGARTMGYASLRARAEGALLPLFSRRALILLGSAAAVVLVATAAFLLAPSQAPAPDHDPSVPRPLARPTAPPKPQVPDTPVEAPPRPAIVVEELVDAGDGFVRRVEREAGSVRLIASPVMDVALDGGVLGTTPITLTFPTGDVELTLTNTDEGLVRKVRFEVLPGVNTPRLFEYTRGHLDIRAPRGSLVFLGKRKLGKTPFKPLALWAGTYEIEVRPPRRPPVKRKVQVLDGETSAFEVEERPLEAE